jgi:hypothetical protein
VTLKWYNSGDQFQARVHVSVGSVGSIYRDVLYFCASQETSVQVKRTAMCHVRGEGV